MRRFGYSCEGARIYSHLLPALSVDTWAGLRLAGPGWALAGDTGGLVDPITGEGIYYAMRSGELVAQWPLDGQPELYPARRAVRTRPWQFSAFDEAQDHWSRC
jgi:flavin-dependent dehydrogenase